MSRLTNGACAENHKESADWWEPRGPGMGGLRFETKYHLSVMTLTL